MTKNVQSLCGETGNKSGETGKACYLGIWTNLPANPKFTPLRFNGWQI